MYPGPPPTAELVYTSKEYRHVFDIYVPIAIGVFVLVAAIVLVAVLVYRRRPPERAARWHEHNLAEGSYALLLAVVVAFLLYITFAAEHKIDTVANAQRPDLTINVIGAKWEWRFNYPAYGINRYSGTVGQETLVLPTNEAIRMRLITRDVIHEFWVPELNFKHDLIPGSVQQITVSFPHSGSFPGACGEFCGLYHSRMTFTVDAVSPAAFNAWARSQQESGPAGKPPAGAGRRP